MDNKEISKNNPEKELITDKSISDDKTKQLVRKIQPKIKKFLQKKVTQKILLKKFLM